MKKSLCESLVQFYPRISDFEDLRSSYITVCVFNNFLCYTAIMLNIVTIHAIRRTSSLPKALKTLLLSLAVSDVGVGLLAQPFYTSILVKWLQQRIPNCSIFVAYTIIGDFFILASFLGVVAVSVDRFLAIHLHLRYQELVTYKRVFAVVISIWLLSVFFALMMLWAPFHVYIAIICIVGVVLLFVTTLAYTRIYLTVRRHRNQIQSLQVQQNPQTDETENFASLVKSAVGIFYVYFLFLLCYLPSVASLAIISISGQSTTSKRFLLFSITFVYLNSSLNPVIYCWKMRHIRHAVMVILRNMSWPRIPTAHE